MSARWLSLEAAVGRALKIYAALKSYFSSEQDTLPRFVCLENHFNNALVEIYLLFYQSILQVFTMFNLFLQRDDPLITRLHGSIQQFWEVNSSLSLLLQIVIRKKSNLKIQDIKKKVMVILENALVPNMDGFLFQCRSHPQ